MLRHASLPTRRNRPARRKRIMRLLAPASTSLLFAAHVLLGCCAHHAHGQGCQAGYEVAVMGDHCDHHDAGQTSCHGADHCPGGPCSHGWCTYVKIDGVRVDRDSSQSPWVASPAALADLLAAACPWGEHVPMVPVEAHSPRLYLLHCALVI